MENLNQILELEKIIFDRIQGLKQQIVEEIASTPLPDVKKISDLCAVVRLSQLQNNVWTAEYYIPSNQAEYVKKALDSVSTAHSFISKVESIIEKGSVKIGTNIYRLNDVTLTILEKYKSINA